MMKGLVFKGTVKEVGMMIQETVNKYGGNTTLAEVLKMKEAE